MTFRRLLNTVTNLDAIQGIRNDVPVAVAAGTTADDGSIPRECQVIAIGDNSVVVAFNGSPVTVEMATDEPLRAGQFAWVSKTADGAYLCYGSVK